MKYYRAKLNNVKEIMTGREVSFLQKSGCNVKILRKATKSEYEDIQREEEAIHEDAMREMYGDEEAAFFI